MFASWGECVTRTSQACNDAAHKFLMLLVIHPFFFLSLPSSRRLRHVMRTLNVDWVQSITENQQELPRKFQRKCQLQAISKFPSQLSHELRLRVQTCFAIFKSSQLSSYAKKKLLARFWRSRKMMKSTAKCFYLNAGYWTADAQVDDITIVFIGQIFIHTLFFSCCGENNEKNRPKRSWHHTVYVYLLPLFIRHQRSGPAYLCGVERIRLSRALLSVHWFHLAAFSFSIVSNADSVDNPYSCEQ